MIRLDLKREPYWLDLAPGMRIRVRPCTTALVMAARASMTTAEPAPGLDPGDDNARGAALLKARAHRWKRMLEDGKFRSAGEITEAEKVTRSFVNRLLRLTLLAPDIVEAILEGRHPKGMQLKELTRAMPSGWEAQRASVGVRPAALVGATLVRSLEA
jgi:hypothetical protein